VGLTTALALLAFAGVNVALLAGTHLASDSYLQAAGRMPVALAVENILAAALKIVGVAAALLAVAGPVRHLRTAAIAVAVCGAFATLAVYVIGSLGEAVVILAGGQPVRLLDAGYLLFFAALAAGFGVLAASYLRRHPQPRSVLVLAVLAPPAVLGLLLFGIPALLAALGLF